MAYSTLMVMIMVMVIYPIGQGDPMNSPCCSYHFAEFSDLLLVVCYSLGLRKLCSLSN